MAARAFARVAPVRAKVSLAAVVVLAILLAVKLGDVQIRQGPWLARTALAQHHVTLESFAKRGAILDRDGGVLVRSLPSESIFAVPADVTEPHRVALQLAPLLRKPARDLEAALRDRSQFRWLARKVPHDVAERVRALNFAGIDTKGEETGVRFVASGRLASTVIGYTGTDENGLGGLEYSLDGLLRGTPGKVQIEADLYGHAMPLGTTHVVDRAVPGKTIVTTLDPYLQFESERLLRAAVKKWNARSGTAIVMDPWTGELLAVANMPDYEPARFFAYPPDAWRDRAITDAYEPGSTFKLITAAAALESGKFTTASRFPARDALVVGGRTIHNAEDGMMAASMGSESIEEIIAYSHNVGAAEVGLATGGTWMYRTIRKFGFGDPTQVELPGENPGIVLTRVGVERLVARDDRVRPQHLDHAARDGARVRRDRERRLAAAPAHHGRDRRRERRARLPLRPRGRAPRDVAEDRRDAAQVLAGRRVARHRQPDRARPGLHDRRQDRHRAGGRERRIPARARTSRRSSA